MLSFLSGVLVAAPIFFALGALGMRHYMRSTTEAATAALKDLRERLDDVKAEIDARPKTPPEAQ